MRRISIQSQVDKSVLKDDIIHCIRSLKLSGASSHNKTKVLKLLNNTWNYNTNDVQTRKVIKNVYREVITSYKYKSKNNYSFEKCNPIMATIRRLVARDSL